MDQESKKLLEDNLKLSQENNVMLRSLHRSMRMRRVMSVVYWLFIIGSAVGAYYFVQPYVDSVMGAYGGAKASLTNFSQFFQNVNK